MPRRTWVAWVAAASLLGLAAYSILTAVTVPVSDRSVFGVERLDARPLYLVAAVLAVASIRAAAARPWWLVVMSVAFVGRAASLLVLGSPDLARRAEIRGTLGSLLLWLLGVLAVLVLDAAATIRDVQAADR